MRILTTVILLISLLVGTLHTGHAAEFSAESHHADGSVPGTANAVHDAPCHDQGSPHSDHCWCSHLHLQAIVFHSVYRIPPALEKQFTAIVPHLIPREYSRIPFIPPRTAA